MVLALTSIQKFVQEHCSYKRLCTLSIPTLSVLFVPLFNTPVELVTPVTIIRLKYT